MKTIKRINKILLLLMTVLFPFVEAHATSNNVPISVDWYYGDDKWDDSPHRSDVKIEALNGAPMPAGTDKFFGEGDLRFGFAPDFTSPGKYEYLIYLDNEDIMEEDREVRYDKTKYRLVFFVQNGANGLTISAYAYDNDKYTNNPGSASKVAKISFKNNDPHRHRGDGTIIKPSDPDNPDDNTGDPDKNGTTDDPDTDSKDPSDNPDDTDDNGGGSDSTGDPSREGKDNEDGGDKTSDPDRDPNGKNGDDQTSDPAKNRIDNILGRDKKSHTNVKTGIKSLGFVLIILLLAIIAYTISKRKESQIN